MKNGFTMAKTPDFFFENRENLQNQQESLQISKISSKNQQKFVKTQKIENFQIFENFKIFSYMSKNVFQRFVMRYSALQVRRLSFYCVYQRYMPTGVEKHQ